MDFLRRLYNILFSSPATKVETPIRFGLLGASKIAPNAIIGPAKTHPEVRIVGVAARDAERARVYARRYGIERVFGGYQELIDDPDIDAVYIPLPNGLHYEWALKALKAGKHVLLEKPSTSNATEANSLFRHEVLQQAKPPVILEAFHVLFHPAWQTFLSCLDPKNIVSAYSIFHVPRGILPNSDIRFQYDLSGGTLMDLGTYKVLDLRQIFGTEPEECLEATPRMMPKGYDQKCDHAMTAKWRFPNGGVGTIDCDLSARGAAGLPKFTMPLCKVVHKELVIEDAGLGHAEGREHVMVKTVTILNPMFPTFWHRIDIEEQHTIRTIKDKKIVRTWTHKEHKKAYTWEEGNGGPRSGEKSWSTYRHQLEQFVNRVKGREGSGCWMSGEDSIKQMEMVDSAYKKAGLPLRPTSTYH
ncbi:putative oxidoreductase [Mollisia scopiformis]|uniref:D-xylose 1-dehydrogenase (NADP(+), D-xylono-1,5-lactone-forming) n=1 Tax=Mollisia scopiformis TaxID=149040 RepID=A0A194WWG0_MOLSC|nr:putative oxidoreductase [Mollisia scopiformis]KUJ12285.1 putative oxidoreductase [Mollisia scopiformis]